MKSAGLIFDESFHYIDHLGPFCSMMEWPLIAFEDSVSEACRKFYPDLTVLETSDLPQTLATCETKPLLEAALGWRGKTLWLPHGLSDKGLKSPFFEALVNEDLLLVYGQKMRDVLALKKLCNPQFSIGNFRYEYYKRHKSFYDALVRERFGELRFVFYAPTWEDSEQNGTFWEAFPKLIEAIPSYLVLLIKVHPNTERKFAPELERCKGLAPQNVLFLEDFPPIYPILERTDLYIGDMSSIGYDFLRYGRPMVFLRKEPAPLMSAGVQISLDQIYNLFERVQNLPKESLLAYSFDESREWPKLLQQQLDTV